MHVRLVILDVLRITPKRIIQNIGHYRIAGKHGIFFIFFLTSNVVETLQTLLCTVNTSGFWNGKTNVKYGHIVLKVVHI